MESDEVVVIRWNCKDDKADTQEVFWTDSDPHVGVVQIDFRHENGASARVVE